MHPTTPRDVHPRTYPRAMRAACALCTLTVALVASLAALAVPRTVAHSQAPDAGAQATRGSASPTPATDRAIRIGTTTLPPYSWSSTGTKPSGPAVWLATEVARELNLEPEWKVYDDLDGVYDALRRGEIDLAATGLPIIAPGDEPFSYSQPWDSSGFSIALHLHPQSRVASTLKHIISSELVIWFGILLGCMVAFGMAVSLIERRRNAEHFGGRSGLWDGVWWSIVTMATVGYGDKVPRTVPGRIIAGIWMLTALVLVTIIAGVLSATLTTSRIAGYMAIERDLRSVRVGIVSHRAEIDMARNLGISPEVYDSPQAAIDALLAHEIDAFLHPTTTLHALVRASDDQSLSVLQQELARGFVAFGISSKMPAPLLRQINNQIVRTISTPEWVIQSRELGDGEN